MSLADALSAQGLTLPQDQPDPDAIARAVGGGLAYTPQANPAPQVAVTPTGAVLPDQSQDNAELAAQMQQGQWERAGSAYQQLASRYGVSPAASQASATPPAPPPKPQGVGAYGGGGAPGPGAGQGLDSTDLAIANYKPQGGPARPAGFVPKGVTTETSPVRPEAEQSIQDLEAARVEQVKAQQNYNVAAGQALAPLQKKQMADQQRLQQTIQGSLQEHADKIATLTENASKAAHEEPEDFWGGQDVGKHIFRTLGMSLMAFGHGLNPNAVNPMEFMDQQIKASAAKQKAKVDAAKGDLEREQNLYGMMKQKFGDDQSALTATQMMQKQAVLDSIDDHFSPPAQKTWGVKGDEQEDPFANLPPTARLGLANMRVSLAESIAKDQTELDQHHVNKITATEEYRQASGGAGGPQDPLATLRRVAEGRKLRGEVETAVPKAEADLRKENAGAAAEEAKATAGGAETKRFEQAAKELHSLSVFSNPAETISQNFQGTEGQEHRLAIDSYNAMISAKFNETHKGLARSNRELFDRGLKTYEINPSTDTPTTIQRKLAQAREKLFNGAPAEGGTPGATVDTAGEGEDYE